MEILVVLLSIVTVASIIVSLILVSSVKELMKYLMHSVETIGAYHEANHEVAKNLISCTDKAEKLLREAVTQKATEFTVPVEDVTATIEPVTKEVPKRRGRPKKKVDDLSDIGLAE